MSYHGEQFRDWRRTRLFGPIVLMTVGGLVMLVLLSVMLVQRFDLAASAREQIMVEQGFARQLQEFDAVIATQVDWDDAITKLDNRFDPDWADFNVGNYLYTFNGFTRAFVVDGAGKPFYAAVRGERSGLDAYGPFAAVADRLVPGIRAAEVRRGRFRPRPGKNNIVIPPIQSNTVAKIGGQVFVVSATLVQPDFGKAVPKGPRAPIVITAKPIDAGMLKGFAARYLLDGLVLAKSGPVPENRRHLVLRDPQGTEVAALSWVPRQPGTVLRKQLQVPVMVVVALLCLLALSVMRRGATMVDDLIASEARAKHLAFHDPLTRLPNRAMLFDRLHALLGGIGTRSGRIAVLCVDLDRFKEINDTLGHHAGDLVIETAANRLRIACSGAPLIARLGGDEFVVLCNVGDPEGVDELGKRILAEVAKPITCEYGRLEIGCSIGAAIIERPSVEPTEALRWADLALYHSKQQGRGRLTFFEPEMDQALQCRRSLEADLRQALVNGELRMAYQPQVDLHGRISAVEALLRWNHPERGEVPPDVFVPLAEETGLILTLGEFVLRRVFAETGQWSKVRVAINVSGEQMRSPGFASLVALLAAQAAIDPARYEIELTETALLSDDPATAGNISALKRLGFTFALDDFGTGYSSLSVLQRFSVDKIKIDRSFVSCLDDGGESEALVDAMIRLARALNLRVIAEGVETEMQRQRLAACGCKEFQGFLIGRPMKLEDVTRIVGEAAEAPRPKVRRAG